MSVRVDRRFWAGQGVWRAVETLHSYRGHTVVPITRVAAGDQGVLDTNRHVVSGLYNGRVSSHERDMAGQVRD